MNPSTVFGGSWVGASVDGSAPEEEMAVYRKAVALGAMLGFVKCDYNHSHYNYGYSICEAFTSSPFGAVLSLWCLIVVAGGGVGCARPRGPPSVC